MSGASRSANGGEEFGSNSTVKSTAASAATISARSADGVIGRPDNRRFSVATVARVRFALDSYHKDISMRASLFDQANMAGMQQIEGAACEHHSLAVAFPLGASENQFILRNYATQISALPVHYGAWLQTHYSNMR